MPIMVRPLVSKLNVATTGSPVGRAPAIAASVSSTDDMVSIHNKSAPPRARAAACSAKNTWPIKAHKKQITQQPVDNEAAQDGQRRAPDGDARADKGRNPQQKGDQRDL